MGLAAIDFTGIATLVASCTASFATILSLVRQGRNRAAVDEKLETLHKLTNGQSEKLNAVTKELGIEQGKALGIQEERAGH